MDAIPLKNQIQIKILSFTFFLIGCSILYLSNNWLLYNPSSVKTHLILNDTSLIHLKSKSRNKTTNTFLRKTNQSTILNANNNLKNNINERNTQIISKPIPIHIVFSSSCHQKNRQLLSTILQLSAVRVKQIGPITNIISGCSLSEQKEILNEKIFYYDFRLYFSQSYSIQPMNDGNDSYLPYNKPFSLREWLNTHKTLNESVIALIDSDFVLFQPLQVNNSTRNVSNFYIGNLRDIQMISDTVMDGVAIAQDWSAYMGNGWWGEKNRSMIQKLCKKDVDPCFNVTSDEAKEYYASTGPPYIMTVNDMRKMIDDYCHFTVEGRKLRKFWMVEMYAYAMAVANHNIKHTLLTNLGITHPTYSKHNGEYWNFSLNIYNNPCDSTIKNIHLNDLHLVGLHYCQMYGNISIHSNVSNTNRFIFYKYALPKDILDCNSMLLSLPPKELWFEAFNFNENSTIVDKRTKQGTILAQCNMIRIVNDAIIRIKESKCPIGFNTFQGTKLLNGFPIISAKPKI